MRAATIAEIEVVSEHIAGGYKLVRSGHLEAAWAACRDRRIRPADLRVWLAALEAHARRRGGPGVYTLAEVADLAGSKDPGPAVKRLAAAGLMSFENHRIEFPAFAGRLVPFPRRMLRHLAGSAARASLIATVFGHLLRCLFFHAPMCHSGGTCKASDIARDRGIHPRQVKAARAELVALGWLEPVPKAQWALNRDGGTYRVNLGWSETPPPPAAEATALPPPDSDKDPHEGDKDQDPAPGVSIKDVRPEDLKDTARTLELHDQAVAAGLLPGAEVDRIRVVAAAEHAMAKGTTNPCGLFIAILVRRLWGYITQADEVRAVRRLKQHLHPEPAHVHAPGPRADRPPLTEDQLLVRKVKALALANGYRGDPFYLLREKDPGWTRPRWEEACR